MPRPVIVTCSPSISSLSSPPRWSRSHGAPENWTAWVISWMVTHRTSSSRSTARLRAVSARFGASSSSRGGTRSSSSARSYWPSTRWESTPVSAPTWAPSRKPEAERSGPDSGPADGASMRSVSVSSSGRMLFRLAAIHAGPVDRLERRQLRRQLEARCSRSRAARSHVRAARPTRRARPRTAVSRRRALRSAGPRPNRLRAPIERSPTRQPLLASRPAGAGAPAAGSRSYSRLVPISRIAPAPRGEPSDESTRATAFLERAEVRDVLAWMRLLVDPQDAAAVVRALARPPIELRQVDLARVIQVARRRKLDLVVGARRRPPSRRRSRPRRASASSGSSSCTAARCPSSTPCRQTCSSRA